MLAVHRVGRTTMRWLVAVVVGALTSAGLITAAGPASAAHIVGMTDVGPRMTMVSVYSPAMGKVIRNRVLHLPGRPTAPTFYMLPGLGGGEDGVSWYESGGAASFFAGKRVNVVMPIGGRSSLFTDWQADDPVLGRNKWQTYLTRELPEVFDRAFRTTRVNALGGVSMSGGSALDIATHAPWRYRAVASYSGCPGTTDPMGMTAAIAMVGRGGGNALNMWGVPGTPAWAAHDPILNADKLRGKSIFLSAASGVPGPIDGGTTEKFGGLIGGGQIEAYVRGCTTRMSQRLNSLGIGHTYSARPIGSHSWGLFRADLRASWPQIARAIGA